MQGILNNPRIFRRLYCLF